MKHNLRTRGRALALTVVLAASTAGCSVYSPLQTTKTQSITDGVVVKGLPDHVQFENLALISSEDGGTAVVTGSVENAGTNPITVTIAGGSGKASTKVAPGTLLTLGDEDLMLKGLKEGAGAMTDVEVTVGDKTVPLQAPVLPPTGYYKEYAPKG
ncbi:hypothetical protein [Janibacter cremeus]|uniref:Lipoprotein n=1 Tax=Janibacter cremeus TaxID=1285192 RepID=A0A852VLI6_9MICO|nr:hypothetical protein [Janibacter cremeus]NYF97937.1 hypothetical protein [Janibacter cremeus]